MEDYLATDSLNALSDYLMRYYGKKVIILLDEYDTPLQEAYVHGYWDELSSFIRNLFNAAFKKASFGFTQEDVWDALKEYGLYENREQVRTWYDGFTFGTKTDIYNPWSIINYLNKKKFSAYWANTSSNSLVGKLIREGSANTKVVMEDLLSRKTFHTEIDEQIAFNQLDYNENAVWSLLLTCGYFQLF